MRNFTVKPIQKGGAVAAAAAKLLIANNLPVSDLNAPAITLWGGFDKNKLCGVIGFERAGETGLLRSLAVDVECRRHGLADLLCAHLISELGGTKEIYLLTETAADFFARLGFVPIERKQAAPSIQQTAQFSSLCPASAVLMVKFLGARRSTR